MQFPIDAGIAKSMVEGKFVALDVPTLQTMQTQWLACLAAISVAHQSYSIAGRSFTRANLAEVSDVLAEISYALKLNSGGLKRVVYSDMSHR